MKLFRACALALVGWYLMSPPLLDEDGAVKINPDAPVAQWSVLKSFDSAEACNEIREQLQRNNRNLVPDDRNGQLKKESALSAQCIGTDDPRLKIIQ